MEKKIIFSEILKKYTMVIVLVFVVIMFSVNTKGVMLLPQNVDVYKRQVEAVTSYIEDGRTNSFYNVDINFLDRTAVKKMRREAVTDEKDPLE